MGQNAIAHEIRQGGALDGILSQNAIEQNVAGTTPKHVTEKPTCGPIRTNTIGQATGAC